MDIRDFHRPRRPSDYGEDENTNQPEKSLPRGQHIDEDFEAFSRQVAICLSHGNWELARATLDAKIHEIEESKRLPPLFDVALAELGLPLRLLNMLEKREIRTVADAMATRPADMYEIPSFGKTMMVELLLAILKHFARHLTAT